MNKPIPPDRPDGHDRQHGRSSPRRMAWWVAFAALAGFLLAEAT